MRPLHALAMIAIATSVTFTLASCSGDDDVDATPDGGTNPPPQPPPAPPPPPADGGDAGPSCVELHTYVIDLVQNKTLENNRPEDISKVNFCTPDKEDPQLYKVLFP
jgi:hypothetical protein